MGKINTDNYPNRPFASYQDDDMFILQDNGGETYTTNVGDIKNLADSRIKLEGVQVNGTDLPISGKKVNVDISGKTDLSVIAYTFNSEMGYFKGAYVTYNGKLYEFIQEHTGAWNPSHVREIRASGQYVRTGNGGYNNGDRATCEGYMTKASGNYSHAEGRETQAVGECTHAEGRETIANGIYQHVEGKYNVADNESKYIHIIGNGIDDNNRSNALTLDWDGNLAVSGDVEDGNGEKISDKADKVINATSGHLAGLDSNGNLTDSGVSPTEEVTVEGNPVTFGSPFEQDAKSVVVSVKPIHDLHGYDYPWPAGGGKNKKRFNDLTESESGVTLTTIKDADGNMLGYNLDGTATAYMTFWIATPSQDTLSSDDWYVDTGLNDGISGLQFIVTPDNVGVPTNRVITGTIDGIYISISQGTVLDNVNIYPMVCLDSETNKSFAPYSNICPISGIDEVEIEVSDGESEPTTTTIPLPSTLYDADVDVTNGDADSRYGMADIDDFSFVSSGTSGGGLHRAAFDGAGAADGIKSISSMLEHNSNGWFSTSPCYSIDDVSGGIIVYFTESTEEAFKAAYADLQICYELATPTTLSFDPADVELLEGTNVVSTNAEKVAVTYGRSLWQDINNLKSDTEGKLDKSDVADVEGDTASKAYSVNDFMLRADGLYKVTQPIAQNASITASNTTKTTIGAVLTALLNS